VLTDLEPAVPKSGQDMPIKWPLNVGVSA
jgi:hypothetical protein